MGICARLILTERSSAANKTDKKNYFVPIRKMAAMRTIVQECDASKASTKRNSRAQKKTGKLSLIVARLRSAIAY